MEKKTTHDFDVIKMLISNIAARTSIRWSPEGNREREGGGRERLTKDDLTKYC